MVNNERQEKRKNHILRVPGDRLSNRLYIGPIHTESKETSRKTPHEMEGKIYVKMGTYVARKKNNKPRKLVQL
jgi:hypothetical protein